MDYIPLLIRIRTVEMNKPPVELLYDSNGNPVYKVPGGSREPKDYKPAETYDLLLFQFNALKKILAGCERRCREHENGWRKAMSADATANKEDNSALRDTNERLTNEVLRLEEQNAELSALIHPIANSHTDCEITDRPLWWILSPEQNMRACPHQTYGTFFGPFWSRELGQDYLDGRRHHFGKKAIVYCGSCNDSPMMKKLFDKSKELGKRGVNL